MPRMDQAPPSQSLVKMLLIADGKVGKSRWAGEAAEAGFNILYMDGDVASATLTQLPVEAQRRIYLMDVGDTMLAGRKDTKFIEVMQEFIGSTSIRWNDDDQKIALRAQLATHNCWTIFPAKMDHNCILVIDSWTSLVESMMQQAATANGITSLADATTTQMRPVYQSGANKATAILQVIRAMPCHVIVLAHPDEYQHKTAPEGKRIQDVRETEMVIDYTKMIPKSTSKPHSMMMAKYFTDVAWMELNPSGTSRYLNFKAKDDRIAGGHFDGRETSDKYSFAGLVQQIGGVLPSGDVPIDSWLQITAPGEAKEAEPKVLDGTDSKPISGMSGLFNKGK